MINKVFRANIYGREIWIHSQLAKIISGRHILDIGCGGQPFRKYCQHLNYKSHDFAQLDAKTQIIGGKYGELDYISDICAIPEKDSTFDAILCTEVLEHVPEPIKAIKEMSRLLKPGGRLILTVPLAAFIHQAPYHFYGGYTPYWFEKFLKESGFSNWEIEPNGGFFRYFGQECQRVTRILFRDRPFTSPLRWFLLPLEVCSLLCFTILSPLVCAILDKYITAPEYTIGYHVLAIK